MRYGITKHSAYRNSHRTQTKMVVHKYIERHKEWNPLVLGTEILSVSVAKTKGVISEVPEGKKSDMIQMIDDCITYINSHDFTHSRFEFRATETYKYAIVKDVPNIVFRIYIGQFISSLEFFTDVDDVYFREGKQIDYKTFDLEKHRLIAKFNRLKSNLNDMI